MEAWIGSMQPNEHHERLAESVREWKTTTTMYWDPANPVVTHGEAEFHMILDGLFLLQEYEGKMPMPNDAGGWDMVDYEGYGLTGYDNIRKQYTGMWIANMNSGILTMKGNLDATGNVLTMYGEMDEIMTGEMGKTVKYVTETIDDDHVKFKIQEVLYGVDRSPSSRSTTSATTTRKDEDQEDGRRVRGRRPVTQRRRR